MQHMPVGCGLSSLIQEFPPMFDHFTQISAVQERAVLLQQASGFVEFSEEPLALIENLPKGLIEDQI